MPDFENPFAFLLVLLIPLLFLLRRLKLFNRISFSAVLADWEGHRFEWNGRLQKFLSVFSKVLLCLGYILVITALADPVISYQEKVYTSLGTDVAFVVDTSPSMAAKDVDSMMRLEAARNAIYKLSGEHQGYRFALVALGSNASVLVPPTNDHDYFVQQLSSLSVGMLGNGSAIGDGLSTAVCHLVSSSAPAKCIVLLTDGENNAGEIHPETAAKLAIENDIKVYVIGIGSKGTVPIDYVDPLTGKQYSGYLDSDFNSAALKKIAVTGGGRYFEVRTLDELSQTLKTVSNIENISQTFTYRTVSRSYYAKFLLAAIIIFVAAWIIKRLILKEMLCFRFKKMLIVRSIFLSFAFVMILLAYSGLSWGTYLVPVQKTGNAVSMVFDISNSMLAKDCPGGLTRLQASGYYAKQLLQRMNGVSSSVVLAKGDGVAAIPLTEDKALIESLLDVMSPSLMTVPGTSLAKGILKAKDSFPSNYASAGHIWVFTDGEETDGQLEEALLECIKTGIPVSIIGFGQESESDILAGDGKTQVKTALRREKISATINRAIEKYSFYNNQAKLLFINSIESGSALRLLSQLSTEDMEYRITSYETKAVERYKLFLILAILSFVFSYIITEFDFSHFISHSGLHSASRSGVLHSSSLSVLLLAFVLPFVLNGCSSDTMNIFKGTYYYHKKQYKTAVADFLSAAENSKNDNNQIVLNYSLYNLGTAYAMLGENDAAKKRFEEISSEAPDSVRYAAFYNAGILAHKEGNYDEARNYFKKALEIDSSKIDAKINMELSIQMAATSVKQNESTSISANEHDPNLSDVEKAVFEHIKENDQNKWKNSESPQSQNLADDY